MKTHYDRLHVSTHERKEDNRRTPTDPRHKVDFFPRRAHEKTCYVPRTTRAYPRRRPIRPTGLSSAEIRPRRDEARHYRSGGENATRVFPNERLSGARLAGGGSQPWVQTPPPLPHLPHLPHTLFKRQLSGPLPPLRVCTWMRRGKGGGGSGRGNLYARGFDLRAAKWGVHTRWENTVPVCKRPDASLPR